MANNRYENQPRTKGKFDIKGSEPLSKRVVGFRLPESLHEQLEQMATEQNISPNELAKQILIGRLNAKAS